MTEDHGYKSVCRKSSWLSEHMEPTCYHLGREYLNRYLLCDCQKIREAFILLTSFLQYVCYLQYVGIFFKLLAHIMKLV